MINICASTRLQTVYPFTFTDKINKEILIKKSGSSDLSAYETKGKKKQKQKTDGCIHENSRLINPILTLEAAVAYFHI